MICTNMISRLQILRYFAFGLAVFYLSVAQSEPEIWKCGNLLTNQPNNASLEGESAKCQLMSGTRSTVTVIGGAHTSSLPNKNISVSAAAAAASSPSSPLELPGVGVTSANPSQQSTREQMSKSILLSEKERLTSRQLQLEDRLRLLTPSSPERLEIEGEVNRNLADLAGLRREIAKLP